MGLINYTSASGGQFSGELRVGSKNVEVFAYPGAVRPILDEVKESGQESQGVYATIDENGPGVPDAYSVAADPPYTTTFEGMEYTITGKVRRTYQWARRNAEQTRQIKLDQGRAKLEEVYFSSARYAQNTNVYILCELERQVHYNNVTAMLADRHKDRDGEFGTDSKLGHQPDDPAPTSYWPQVKNEQGDNVDFEVPVRAWHVGQQRFLELGAAEVEWGQVRKTLGQHTNEAVAVSEQYQNDVDDAYIVYIGDQSEANWQALIGIDPDTYPWPPYVLQSDMIPVRATRTLNRIPL